MHVIQHSVSIRLNIELNEVTIRLSNFSIVTIKKKRNNNGNIREKGSNMPVLQATKQMFNYMRCNNMATEHDRQLCYSFISL